MGDSWGWGGLSARRGLGLQTREGGGWKPIVSQPKCQEKFMVKAGSCWCHWLPPLLYTYSCLLMSVRLQMAQLRGQLWP